MQFCVKMTYLFETEWLKTVGALIGRPRADNIRPYGHKIAIIEFGRIMNRHYKTLELDKILEKLAGMTSIEDAREMALNLEPVFELKRLNSFYSRRMMQLR